MLSLLKYFFCVIFLSVQITVFCEPLKVKKAPKELTLEEKSKICSKYKGKYISYLGTDVYYVTKECKRRLLGKKEGSKITKMSSVQGVGAKVIHALEKEAWIPEYTIQSAYKKYKNKCIQAADVVYRVVEIKGIKGKRGYPDRNYAKRECSEIIPVSFGVLRVLTDFEDFPRPTNVYPKRKEEKLEVLDVEKLCSRLQKNVFYSFHSKVYKVIKKEKTCFLEEQDTFSMKVRVEIGKQKPKELKPSEYLSLEKKALKKQKEKKR